MLKVKIQHKIGVLLAVSLAVVTLVVSPMFTLDPINEPKLWLLAIFAFAIFFILIFNIKDLLSRDFWSNLLAPGFVLFFMTIAFVISPISKSKQFFGDYGRNTGLLAYFGFTMLFVAASLVINKEFKKYFLVACSFAFGVNAFYGIVQATGNDFFKWNNPYAPVIGTLGNPNFAAAFLGIGVAIGFTYLIQKESSLATRIFCFTYLSFSLFAIQKSDAQQGLIVCAISIGIVIYFVIVKYFKKILLGRLYLSLSLIAAIMGVVGTLNRGPLASILYGDTVKYRGDYWRAGWEMFKSSPWFGIGLDSYGDYYRSTRTLEATLRRGPSIVTNAAHNVFIDIAATAGIFALLAYLLLIFLGFRAAWRIHKRNKNFDAFFVAVFTAWIGYLLQSTISINNIALGIWGWTLPGVLIAIDRWDNEVPVKSDKKKAITDFSGMHMIAGLVIGGVIGYMPFKTDVNFRHAIETSDAKLIAAAAEAWPTNTNRLNTATLIMHQNNLSDLETSLARKAVEFNPRSFDAWFNLYSSPSVSGNEKREILDRLKVLDPHNPDLKKLG